MARVICVVIAVFGLGVPASGLAQIAAGDWSGVLRAPGGLRHVAVHIHKTLGGFTGSVDSPERNAAGSPLSALKVDGDTLSFSSGAARYQAHWDAQSGAWVGVWAEAGVETPLHLAWNDDGLIVTPRR